MLRGAGGAATYEVGPGKALATPGDVPWEGLQPGDVVRIHWRSTPYRNKWVICRQGNAEAPIVVQGVPGPGGELPVIDGSGATTRSQLDYWGGNRSLIKIGGASVPANTTPKHIVIEGLDLTGAKLGSTFSYPDGSAGAYTKFGTALWVEAGENITIRGCTLRGSGNGLVTSSSDAAASRDILVEGNYIHGNGNSGSAYEHNTYTASIGIVFQNNRFGPLATGANGVALKDRSADVTVRWNWIEGGSRQLDLVEGEDSLLIRNHPKYHETFVYGNVLMEVESTGNNQIVHYGGDGGVTLDRYRKGKLYFYNNTVISRRTGTTVLFRLSTNDESCDARNNIMYVTAAGNYLGWFTGTGRVDATANWLKPGYKPTFEPTITGALNESGTLTGTDPGFADAASEDWRLTAASPCVAQAVALAAETSAHAVLRQYVKHRSSEDRLPFGVADIGAYEYHPYTAWKRDSFGSQEFDPLVAGDSVDFDGDGLSTVLEYAFLGNPLIPDAFRAPLVQLVSHAGLVYPAITFARRPAPCGLQYVVEHAMGAVGFTEGSTYADAGEVTQTSPTAEFGASATQRQVRSTTSTVAPGDQLLRVRVSVGS